MRGSDYFSVSIYPEIIPGISVRSNACGGTMGWENKYPNWIYKTDVPAGLNLVIETVINKGYGYERSYDTLLIGKGQTQSFTAVYK